MFRFGAAVVCSTLIAGALVAALVLRMELPGGAGEGYDPRGEPPRPGPAAAPVELVAEERDIAAANTAFGFELLRLVHEQTDEPNLLLSPLSASVVLAMTANGAAGDAYDAMLGALGLAGLDEAIIHGGYRSLMQQLPTLDDDVELRLANSVWAREGIEFEAEFLELAGSVFDAKVSTLNFRDPHSPEVMNAWAAETTNGRISRVIEHLHPLEIMILMNAVYFHAPWSQAFDEARTRPMDFRAFGGRTVEVPTMMREDSVSNLRADDVTVVDLPYGGGAFSMTLVLPARGLSLEDLLEAMTPRQWNEWTASLTASRVTLALPKFRFESVTELTSALANLGMGPAFNPAADFSRLTRTYGDAHISTVRQQAFIEVDEAGTEAAAVTSVGVSVTAAPPPLPLIHFDRPFLFAIREAGSSTPLFLGRVGDPSEG